MIKNCFAEVLIAKNLDKRDIVKMTGLDNHTIDKLFKSKTIQIKFSTLDKLCYALECNTNDIIKYIPD